MAQKMVTAGQRTELGNTSLAGSLDDPEINRPNAETQAQNPAALVAARLELLREFAHEQYSAVERQALIAQWSLEDGDEVGAGYALTRLVSYAAVAAETALDIAALKTEATRS
jgi:hypothetical protein